MTAQNSDKENQIKEFFLQIKNKSDKLINYFLIAYFISGILLAVFYDTWEVAFGVGSLSLIAYYSTKYLLPKSTLYQYVLSIVLGIFMAQYIYQMHGMFEMHFVAFIGSALLITYQNWKIQIPIVLVVVVHHALFGYLQFIGIAEIYFTQLDYMDLQTFIIHVILAAVIFFICGLWAYHFKKYSTRHIEQTYEMVRLQEENKQRENLLALSENLRSSNDRLNEAQHIAHLGSWEWDVKKNKIYWSDELYRIFEADKSGFNATYEGFLNFIHNDDRQHVSELINQCLKDKKPFSYEARIITKNKKEKIIYAEGKALLNERKEVIKMFGIAQDITKRKEAEEALRTYNDELKKSNHELDRFVYSASHDLRAPLLSMQGIVDLTEDITTEELTGEHMRMLRGSIRKLDGFIAEILNYSRNSRMEVKADKVDFDKMLNEIAGNLQYMNGASKQVEISFEIKEKGTFYSDKARISVLLNNLISNSIRYYNPDASRPYVKITVATDEKSAEIRVEDNGIGINEEYHQKVFEMFYRVSESSSGSGLGLYIVKETIDKMKGDIAIDSHAGKGTTFRIAIPNLFYQ
jgi:PAS domain S-box-containing protein